MLGATERARTRLTAAVTVLLLAALSAVVISRLHKASPSHRGFPSPSASPSSSGPPSPTPAQCTDRFLPAQAAHIPLAVSGRPPGSVFCFSAGIYRMTDLIVPKDDDEFIGEGAGGSGT